MQTNKPKLRDINRLKSGEISGQVARLQIQGRVRRTADSFAVRFTAAVGGDDNIMTSLNVERSPRPTPWRCYPSAGSMFNHPARCCFRCMAAVLAHVTSFHFTLTDPEHEHESTANLSWQGDFVRARWWSRRSKTSLRRQVYPFILKTQNSP